MNTRPSGCMSTGGREPPKPRGKSQRRRLHGPPASGGPDRHLAPTGLHGNVLIGGAVERNTWLPENTAPARPVIVGDAAIRVGAALCCTVVDTARHLSCAADIVHAFPVRRRAASDLVAFPALGVHSWRADAEQVWGAVQTLPHLLKLLIRPQHSPLRQLLPTEAGGFNSHCRAHVRVSCSLGRPTRSYWCR